MAQKKPECLYQVTDRTKSVAEVRDLYDVWAKDYNSDMGGHEYTAPGLLVKDFLPLGVDRQARILDIGCGTGLVSKILKQHGYTNVDGLDGSPEMLEVAKKNNLYNNYYCALLGKDVAVKEIDSDTYDAIVMVGVFVPGHMNAEVLPEILRMTKIGGVIQWNRLMKLFADHPGLGEEFDEEVEKLVTQGRWKHHIPNIDTENYRDGWPGRTYTMERVS